MDMLKSKEGLAEEVKSLRARLQSSREQNSVLSDQLLLLQKECKNLLNSISGYEESNHKLSSQVARLTEKNSSLKKKLRQAVTACADIKKQAESYISSIQGKFYEQLNREEGFSVNSGLRLDGLTISVSERENESSVARFDNEDIIMAYTQEIRDKQTEIESLVKTVENKSQDLEDFKMNLKGVKESFEKKLLEKEKIIKNLQQEVRALNEEISAAKKEFGKKGPEDVNQIEALQNKLNSQSKKFENYIKTIANLEKQIQLQIVRASELEGSIRNLTDALKKTESEKKEIGTALVAAQGKVKELEAVKIEQVKIMNKELDRAAFAQLEGLSSGSLKEMIESLEDDNKKLLEANTFIQNYSETLKKNKDSEIAHLKQEITRLKEGEEKTLPNKPLSGVKESPFSDIVLYFMQIVGESDPARLREKVKELVRLHKDSPDDLRLEIMSVVKEYSNKVLSVIARVSNSVQRVNEKLADFMQRFYEKMNRRDFKGKYIQNLISSYEITTVNECSEKEDESFEEDSLEIKLEQSARKIKELNSEIKLLKDLLEQKDDLIHDLELKGDRLRIDKEKKQKESNDLYMKIAELENELKTGKEIFEISDKKKTAMINSLEGRISQMKKEIEHQKSSVLSEKEELFDHIIRIEQESKNQSSLYKGLLDDSRAKLRSAEMILNGIEEYLGADFNGDHLESIKKITKKKRSNSFTFNLFKRSSSKSESGSKGGTPTGSEVLSPSASGTTSVDYMKAHKALEQEKMFNMMNVQQIEALRENIRHLEYENSKNAESKIYQNLRGIIIEILKMLPVMGENIERKIQIMIALLWLSNEEKSDIDSRRLSIVGN